MARLPLLYFGWAVVVGLTVAWVTPPWQNPDEGAHAERAIQIALGHLVGERVGPHYAGGLTDPGVNASANFLAAMPFHGEAKASAAMLAQAEAVKPGRPALSTFGNTAAYPPFLYAAAAAAARVGRASRMHVAASLRLMRAFNVVGAAALGAAALAVSRRTRLAIAATLLLPMSLALAASPSQDALLIPLAAWAVAAIDRARVEGAVRPPGMARQGTIAAALLLVMLARPPYLPLVLLLTLLPGQRLRAGLAQMLLIAGLTLLWSVYVALHVSVPMYVASPARQLVHVLGHPIAFAVTFWQTWTTGYAWFGNTMVGVLGWLDTPLPLPFIQAAEGVVLLSLLSAATPDQVQGGLWSRHRIVAGLLACLGAMVAVCLSIYLIWSAPGAPLIDGIQGRYFLPLLPALALAMPDLGRWVRVLRPVALVGVLLLGVIGPVVTITTLIDRYYLQP